MKIELNNKVITVIPTGETKRHRSFHGLIRALIKNLIDGVTAGFQKQLEIQGVGYSAELRGKSLMLNLGFSHPILFRPPKNVSLEVPNRNNIIISGIDKHLVGDVSAKIRSFKPPEPYKGKGVRYLGEEVRRKVGKTSA